MSEKQNSTSESTQEPNQPSAATIKYEADPLKLMTHDLIMNMTKYITGEIQASAEDYVLLEQLNLAAAARYEDLGVKSQSMLDLFLELQGKLPSMQPYLNQIDEMHDNVEQLDIAMKDLDAYVSHLEMQVKNAYK